MIEIQCKENSDKYISAHLSKQPKYLFIAIEDNLNIDYTDVMLNKEDVKKLISNLVLAELRMEE